MEKVVEVEILQMVFGGDGFARLPDGRAVFVPFVLPGERVRIQITQEKKNYAHCKLIEVLSPSEFGSNPLFSLFSDLPMATSLLPLNR